MSQPWQHRLDEMEQRRRLVRTATDGKRPARETLTTLADPGSFREVGELAGSAEYDGDQLGAFTPADTVIGVCKVDGRDVSVSADDAAVAGDHIDTNAAYKAGSAQKTALEWKIPYVRLLDNVRGSVLDIERGGRAYLSDQDSAGEALRLLDTVPVASVVIGPVSGPHATDAALSHFSVGVEPDAALSLAADSAAGERIPASSLARGGAIDNLVETSDEALGQVRRFLSYLPSNVWQMASRGEVTDDRNRREEQLLTVIPERRSRLYDPYQILEATLDRGSMFEIAPSYGQSCITALARVDGYPVGVMAKNPRSSTAGAMDSDAGDKVMRFFQLCDIFHLPLVYFVDEPGFMVGVEAQKEGIVRDGARLVLAAVETRMPFITFMVRQVYGVAGALFTRASGMYKHYAWATANWGGMHIEGGTMAAYRRDIESAPDPKARLAEIERHLWMLSSPFRSLEAFEVDDMIDPRDTRPLLCDFVESAQGVLATQLGPPPGVSYRP